MHTSADKEGFLKLIQDNWRIIFKICNSYCSNASDREDLGQEIVYQLWKSGKSFDANYKFSTWMYQVALNVAISFYRKKTASPVISFTEAAIDIPDKTSRPDEQEENIYHLQKFIAEMKELDRALMLLYLEEKPYQEIAEILGISETNVATKISRIKEGLKQKFSNLKKEEDGRH
jgi:RNA polymerase sigma factor (sigma-70 family)